MCSTNLMPPTTLLAALFTAGAFVTPTAAQAQVACRYEVAAIIQAPPCGIGNVVTTATAISPDGHIVVGYARCPLGNPQPFKWTAATGFQYVALPPWLTEALPADVNDSNVMVGTGAGPVAGQRGWVCDLNTGTWTELLPQNPPTGWSGAYGINSSNTVCGYRSVGQKGDPVNPQVAFVWNAATGFVDFPAAQYLNASASGINDHGATTGTMFVKGVIHSFLWEGGVVTDLGTLAGYLTRAEAINNANLVVGYAAIGPGFGPPVRAFFAGNLPMTSAGTLPGFERSYLMDVNDDWVGVGECRNIQTDGSIAVVWNGWRFRDLSSMLPPASTFSPLHCTSISESGRIVCEGSAPGNWASAILDPVSYVGDVTGDCAVEYADLLAVIAEWGTTWSPADINGDRLVNVADLLCVILHWTG